jgi:hypothetical protein
MAREPLQRAPQTKTITVCSGWFFGGPHQWNSRDICTMCGITRTEARILAKYRVQPALECEEAGHPRPAGWTVIPYPVGSDRSGPRLVVDNTRRVR